jgi:cell division septum initiation protein DivIVA
MIASVDRLFTQPAQHDPLGVRRKDAGVSGSNGADLGQVMALLSDVLIGQREMKQDIQALTRRVDDLAEQVATLRQDVAGYHASVIGHGILISEHDARLNRIEQHLDLPPTA